MITTLSSFRLGQFERLIDHIPRRIDRVVLILVLQKGVERLANIFLFDRIEERLSNPRSYGPIILLSFDEVTSRKFYT
jgi:hypothetical protein